VEVTSETHEDLPRLFLRPGAALPLGPAREWTTQPVADETIELLTNGDACECEMYADAGDGFGYQRGEFSLAKIGVRAGEVTVSGAGKFGAKVRLSTSR
jgi:hypothetical protein